MRKIYYWLMGDVEKMSFEQRVFNFVVLLGSVLSLTGGLLDVASGEFAYPWLGFGILWATIYYFSRFRNHFAVLSIVSYVILVFLMIPIGWVSSNGIYGILPYFAPLFVVTLCIVLRGKARIALLLSTLFIVMALIWMDRQYPLGMVYSYRDFETHLAVPIFLPLALLGMGILGMVYANTYETEKVRSAQYARALEENYQQQLYYMETLEELIEKLKSERHDYNQHLGVVYGLLEGEEIDRVKQYARTLIQTAVDYQSLVYLPYSMIRAMLNYKLSRAKMLGFQLNLKVDVPPELYLEEHDITIILGNLLDNAIEACMALPEAERYLVMQLHYKPNYLVLHLENPTILNDQTEVISLKTTKADNKNHGFGIKNIQYLVNRHDGIMDIEIVDRVFKVKIALLVGGVI